MTTLVVTADRIATRLGLPLPLTAAQEARINLAIEDSQAKVLTYLNRASLEATFETVESLSPDTYYPLDDRRAWWTVANRWDDRYAVSSYTPHVNADGTTDPDLFDVTFTVGLGVAGDPELYPIRQFIEQDATLGLRLDPSFGDVDRAVTSASAEGQSLSFEKGSANPDTVGGAVTLRNLSRWKRRVIYQRPSYPLNPWPYARR